VARHHAEMSNGARATVWVEFRAFRGTQRSSVYRAHVVEACALQRIVDAGAKERLAVLGQIEIDLPGELDAARAGQRVNALLGP